MLLFGGEGETGDLQNICKRGSKTVMKFLICKINLQKNKSDFNNSTNALRSLLQHLDGHLPSQKISILSFSCTPWIPMPPFIITCSLSAIHLNWGVPDPWWRGHAQTQNCTCTNICSTVDVPLAATLKNILYNACYVWEEPLIDFHPTIT